MRALTRYLSFGRSRQAAHMTRLTGLLPRLIEEFHAIRDPKEVLDCADAVVAYYEETTPRPPSRCFLRRRTSDCLRAGTCEGLAT